MGFFGFERSKIQCLSVLPGHLCSHWPHFKGLAATCGHLSRGCRIASSEAGDVILAKLFIHVSWGVPTSFSK